MTSTIDLSGNNVIADSFTGTVETSAGNVSVTAGTDGLSAGTAQEALQDLATRVQALEDAAV